MIIFSILNWGHTASWKRPYATGRLEDSGRQNDEKIWRETVNFWSCPTFFRHSAAQSVSAVLMLIRAFTEGILKIDQSVKDALT